MDLSSFFVFDESTRVWVERESTPFDYSDGESQERYLLEMLKQSEDVSSSSTELFDRMIDWPSTYHLSPRRGNLLRPFRSWFAGKRILEIGCGCGAISRFLGEAGATVVSIEGSIVRAEIARERCRDLANVEIICTTSDRASVLGEFDGVMLIGVLEYARKFLGSHGIQRLLESCRAQLSEHGVLFVAIENQLGLKYFAGASEDHVGIAMFGIEERYSQSGVATFGREELSRYISNAQFPSQQWWYPFPDYKLPLSLLSEDAAAGRLDVDFSAMITGASAADPQRPFYQVFSPERAWQPIYRNGLAHDLSNSFLVLASKHGINVLDTPAVAFHFSVDRLAQFAKAVEIRLKSAGELEVHHTRVYPNAPVAPSPVLSLPVDDVPFYGGEHWQLRLSLLLSVPGWTTDTFVDWYVEWWHALQQEAGLPADGSLPQLAACIDSRLVDALPRNLIVDDDGRRLFFDLEWRFGDSIELGYLLFRGVYCSLWELRSVACPADGTPLRFRNLFDAVLMRLGINVGDAELERYANQERDFQRYTSGRSSVDCQKVLTAELSVAPLVVNDFPRLNVELTRKDEAITTQSTEIHRLLFELTRKDEAIATQSAEIHRLFDELTHKDGAIATQSTEIHRLFDELARKDGAIGTQGAEIHRLFEELTHKDDAIATQSAEIHRLLDSLNEKHLALSTQMVEIERLNRHISESSHEDELIALHHSEIQRLLGILDEKHAILALQAAEIRRLNEQIYKTPQAEELEALSAQDGQEPQALLDSKASVGAAEVLTFSQLSNRISDLDAELANSHHKVAAQEEEIGRLTHVAETRLVDVEAQTAEIQRLQERIREEGMASASQMTQICELEEMLRINVDKLKEQAIGLGNAMQHIAAQQHIATLQSERINHLSAEQGALMRTKWFRLRAALTARPRSARQLARAGYLLVAMVAPRFIRRSLSPMISQARALVTKSEDPPIPQLPRSPIIKQGQPAGSYIVHQRKPDLAHRRRVVHVIANFMTGGSSKLVVDLIEQLGHRYQQTILTSYIPTPEAYSGVAIHELREPNGDTPFVEFFRAQAPDFIHVHYWGDCDEPWYAKAFSAAELLMIPVIENINTPVAPFVSRDVSRYVYVSEYVQEMFGTPGAANRVIYPGSDFSHFSLKKDERPSGAYVGMVYRLERDKLNEEAIIPFIKVAQMMPTARVLIVGGGSLLEPFQQKVAAAGVSGQFEFTGYVSYDELPALYRRMAVFVAPVWKESFGQVSPFAMNMQVPVVGYDIGAIGEIVNNAKYLAAPGDADALAKIVMRLLQNESERNTLAREHRKRARDYFSLDAMIVAYRTLYDETPSAQVNSLS